MNEKVISFDELNEIVYKQKKTLKSCSIEISESSTEVSVARNKFGAKEAVTVKGVTSRTSEGSENTATFRDSSQRSGAITAQFEGSDHPEQPKLKWFAHDDSIKGLIEMRCSSGNTIKNKTLHLSGSSSATMSRKTAYSIDQAISKIGGIGANYAMEQKADRESQSTLIFSVEF